MRSDDLNIVLAAGVLLAALAFGVETVRQSRACRRAGGVLVEGFLRYECVPEFGGSR